MERKTRPGLRMWGIVSRSIVMVLAITVIGFLVFAVSVLWKYDWIGYAQSASAWVEGAAPVDLRLHRRAVAQFRGGGSASLPRDLIFSVGRFEEGDGTVLAEIEIHDSAILTDSLQYWSFNVFLPGPLAPDGRRVHFEEGVGGNGELMYWTTGIGMSGEGCIGYARSGTLTIRRSPPDRITASYDVAFDFPIGGWTQPGSNCHAVSRAGEAEFRRVERRSVTLDNPTGFSWEDWEAWRRKRDRAWSDSR